MLNEADSLHLANHSVATVIMGICVGLLDFIAAWTWLVLLLLLFGVGKPGLTCIDKYLRWTLLLVRCL